MGKNVLFLGIDLKNRVLLYFSKHVMCINYPRIIELSNLIELMKTIGKYV